jgi:hypothetical protein
VRPSDDADPGIRSGAGSSKVITLTITSENISTSARPPLSIPDRQARQSEEEQAALIFPCVIVRGVTFE